MAFEGELAALAAAMCWASSALFFTSAGERVGSMVVNLVRLLFGFGFLALTTAVTRGLPLPTDATAHAWLWLSLSGLVGFTFGDACLFRAFLLLGPRLATLLMSLAPPFTALLGYLFLGETLSGLDLAGMAITLAGIAMAVRARQPAAEVVASRLDDHGEAERADRRVKTLGVILAVLAALGQAGGLVLSKHGMGAYDPLAATEIRILAGFGGLAVVFGVTRRLPALRAGLKDRRGMRAVAVGAFFGSFLGVSLSLVSIQLTQTGVAASIMATAPVLIIPLAIRFRQERIGPMAIVGAIVAVVGVALLFAA